MSEERMEDIDNTWKSSISIFFILFIFLRISHISSLSPYSDWIFISFLHLSILLQFLSCLFPSSLFFYLLFRLYFLIYFYYLLGLSSAHLFYLFSAYFLFSLIPSSLLIFIPCSSYFIFSSSFSLKYAPFTDISIKKIAGTYVDSELRVHALWDLN
jgi:hypothetical protein